MRAATGKAKPKPKATVGRAIAKAPSPKKTDVSAPTTPRGDSGRSTPRSATDRGPPRKARTEMGTNQARPKQRAGPPARQSPAETSTALALSDIAGGIGGVTSRDGGQLIQKDDPEMEAARVLGEVDNLVEPVEDAHQRSRSSSVAQTVSPTPGDSPFPEGADWRPSSGIVETPMTKEGDVLASPARVEVARNSHAHEEDEREWSRLNGLSGNMDKVIDLFATKVAPLASGSIDRSTASDATIPPRKRETHHQILQLQEEVKKLQAPYDELHARGQRDLDTQVAIARLQMELQTLKEAVTASNAAPPDSSHACSPEASTLAPGANAVPEPLCVRPPSLTAESENFLSDFRSSNDVICESSSPSKVEETILPAIQQESIAGSELQTHATASPGPRRDRRDQELQQLLSDVYNKICVCSERLKEQKAASKAAVSGLESLHLPDDLLGDADDARRDTWEEIEWLRRALVGMHQHLVYAHERTRTLEQQCQEYEAHVQTLGQNGDQTLLSTSFESDRSKGLQATSDFSRSMDSNVVARELSPRRDLDLQTTYGMAPLLTSAPKVRPPKNYQTANVGSSAAPNTVSPPISQPSLGNGNVNAIGVAMRAIPPMQDLDTSVPFAYEPYKNVSSSVACCPPMVAVTPPVDGLAIGASRMQSVPRSVLVPTRSVSVGSFAEVYPSGVASVGTPSRPITMMASYASGSNSVGVPGKHIPASSSRPPSTSPLRQQRPMMSTQQGLTQCIAVAPGSTSNGTALFNCIDSNKDGVIDRWELKTAMNVGAVKLGPRAQSHVAETTSVVLTPRAPAPMVSSRQAAYPSTMQYFAPMAVGPSRSSSREPMRR